MAPKAMAGIRYGKKDSPLTHWDNLLPLRLTTAYPMTTPQDPAIRAQHRDSFKEVPMADQMAGSLIIPVSPTVVDTEPAEPNQ